MDNSVAIIDLGTNTFHLLIAEKKSEKHTIIYQERVAVKLGLGGINDGIILSNALQLAIRTLIHFNSIILKHKIRQVYAFGTSALRNAENADEILTQIRQATGIEVTIISGEQEAQFIYEGIKFAMDLGNNPSLIVDIGGGSVEFIIGNNEKIFWKSSIEIGAQRLIEKFKLSDPLAPQEITVLNNYFEQILMELTEKLKIYNPETLAGSSGTFDTLSDIYCAENKISKKQSDRESPLTIESFYSIYNELISKNRAERLQIPGMVELRVDMIVIGCCLVNFILQKNSFKNIRVSGYSLKEGVLATLSKSSPGIPGLI